MTRTRISSFQHQQSEDHSLAKAVNLNTLKFNNCGGMRHIFFFRQMRTLEELDISNAIVHRRSERSL